MSENKIIWKSNPSFLLLLPKLLTLIISGICAYFTFSVLKKDSFVPYIESNFLLKFISEYIHLLGMPSFWLICFFIVYLHIKIISTTVEVSFSQWEISEEKIILKNLYKSKISSEIDLINIIGCEVERPFLLGTFSHGNLIISSELIDSLSGVSYIETTVMNGIKDPQAIKSIIIEQNKKL